MFHYPYQGYENLFLPFKQCCEVLDKLIKLKREGYPIDNSIPCLQALKDNSWNCHDWQVLNVESDGQINQGCYVKNRGEISCQRCGFACYAEWSLAYEGVRESIEIWTKVLSW